MAMRKSPFTVSLVSRPPTCAHRAAAMSDRGLRRFHLQLLGKPATWCRLARGTTPKPGVLLRLAQQWHPLPNLTCDKLVRTCAAGAVMRQALRHRDPQSDLLDDVGDA